MEKQYWLRQKNDAGEWVSVRTATMGESEALREVKRLNGLQPGRWKLFAAHRRATSGLADRKTA